MTSKRFGDFQNVPLGSVEVTLAPGQDQNVELTAGPFLDDEARGKHYALGRGDYEIASIGLGPNAEDRNFPGRAFTIGAGEGVFTAVVYDQAYFDKIRYSKGALAWMTESFARPTELFDPASNGYRAFPTGFDAMMGVRQHYRVFDGFPASQSKGGFCEQAGGYAKQALGLTRDWNMDGKPTHPDHHGFDMLVGLTPAMVGGAACGWLGVQVSGLFESDLSLGRSAMILVHETGHIFGAPHCDPIQGYVMCSGEKNDRYKANGTFVWHQSSRDAMKNPYD